MMEILVTVTMNPPATQAFIRVRDVSKYFDKFCALDSVSLDIELGQKLVICGPSGSGKSTLIRCINRLERHEAGEIRIDGIVVDDSPTGSAVLRNNVGMVFQQFNLFPHLTILENLMLGPVRARKMAEADARDLAMHYLERVRIPEQFSKYPAQLSGGQQQRVAIARALCMAPKIMLLFGFLNNSVNIQRNYRAASSNVWRLRGRFAWRQRSCFLTNRHRRLIRK